MGTTSSPFNDCTYRGEVSYPKACLYPGRTPDLLSSMVNVGPARRIEVAWDAMRFNRMVLFIPRSPANADLRIVFRAGIKLKSPSVSLRSAAPELFADILANTIQKCSVGASV